MQATAPRESASSGFNVHATVSLFLRHTYAASVAHFLAAGADPNGRNEANQTLLMVAIKKNWLAEDIHELLRAGADPNARDTDGDTALIAGELCGAQLTLLSMLVDYGADVSATNNDGSRFTAQEDPATLTAFRKNDLRYHARRGEFDATRRLLESGHTLEDPIVGALEEAAGHGRYDVVVLLLARGANVNACNLYGGTPLMRAAADSERRIVELLLERGANVNAREKGSMTALMSASAFGSRECDQLLLCAGADVNAQDDEGWTALHYATCCGDAKLVKGLLEYGADSSIVTKAGHAASHDAYSADMLSVYTEFPPELAPLQQWCANQMRRAPCEW